MTDRVQIEKLLNDLYASRVDGRLEDLCALFSPQANFRIAGAGDVKPIAINVHGVDEIRTWLSMMVRTFKLNKFEVVSVTIENSRAAVHWRASILSKITGVIIPTELIDLVEIVDGRIGSYIEFFVAS
jgi:ketosteroid isomerase-like protein